ncbi:nitric-oxide reductase large subunit [Oligoflexus tunisiensis]|uniref:nitric-oxide reductase large subunit n=1 Tax=Oligoflexus tunisiensis TaxID=708132 RepID=UPI000AD54997|nr:nitric-oxide reductase large subunit [Oligoflexus tunisiensis]
MKYKRLWISLALIVGLSFILLLGVGAEIYRTAPPLPERVVSTDGQLLFTGQQIRDGQNVWQSTGGQQLGSIWGHGSYVAPDWSADWLHREGVVLLDLLATQNFQKPYESLTESQKASLQIEARELMRTNNFDPNTQTLQVDSRRAQAIAAVGAHYDALFAANPELKDLRSAYAMHDNAVPDPARRQAMVAFFFWTAWASITERPGETISYTNNWPHEPLLGNRPTTDAFLWTMISIVALIAGIGALAYAMAKQESDHEKLPAEKSGNTSLLWTLRQTPSMRATVKYFYTVMGLLLFQIILGAVTAHYGVEGQSFYGFPLADYLPYAVTRTWHTQLGIFWIATAWLGTGLFMVPLLAGKEPRYQKLGVNILWFCLVVIVVGSMGGQWFAIQQKMGLVSNFWFGHQGYEYVDLGRFWQIFLFAGLFIWLGLMLRGIVPALKRPEEPRHLLAVFGLSAFAIALFYGAGLMWGRQTHLAVAEYWRWWVVHLWVEGFFEVFATAVIALIFVRLGLLRQHVATFSVLFGTSIFLLGGILGTFHHLYFSGTPTSVLALGATFSALEVVPLALIGFEAYRQARLTHDHQVAKIYRWPILFLVAVSFWNLVGAGVFGFLINPPLALYYMQGLNTTPVHGHTALFGVYGMLGIGLMLFCMRSLEYRRIWSEGALRWSFWLLNGGLMVMVLLSLLPIGLLQTQASVEHGLWYARSAEFLNTPLMQVLKWLRVPGDIIFALGVAALLAFFVRRSPRSETVEAGAFQGNPKPDAEGLEGYSV